ncbi:MAG: hypothetical protein JHC71_15835 [Blastococcus sp.]|nr:hypothetical protein [Blastococcus sp.]
MRRLPAVIILACLAFPAAVHADPVERTFTERGQTVFVVPEGVTQVQLTAVGERGGDPEQSLSSIPGARGGRGAWVGARLAVSPGQRLYLNVGVGGGQRSFLEFSGAGGGSSDVRVCPVTIAGDGCPAVPAATDALLTRVLVAGGGGGAGANLYLGLTEIAGGNGGDAGRLKENGAAGQTLGARIGGGGATLTAGGAGGVAPGRGAGAPGALGLGGDGGVEFNKVSGAGGGGGLFGGGGSASSDINLGGPVAGGGGGSSFANTNDALPGATVPTIVQDPASGFSSESAPSVTVGYDDTVAPQPTVTSPGPGQAVGARPTIRGTAGTLLGDEAQVTVVTKGPAGPGPTFTAPVSTDGTFSATAPTPLIAGTWEYTVEQSDDGGNRGTVTRTMVVDPAAPVLSLAAPVNGGFVATSTPELRGVAGAKAKDEPSVQLRVYPGADATGSPLSTFEAPVGAGGGYTGVSAALPDGRYAVTATQRDNGQGTTTTAPSTFLVDTVAPTIDVPFLDGTEVGVGAVVGLFYRCDDLGSGLATCDGPRPSGAALPTTAPGVFTDTITATDRAGNVTTRAVTYRVTGPAAGAGNTPPAGSAATGRRTSPKLTIRSLTRARARKGRVPVTVRGSAVRAASGQRVTVVARRGKRTVRARTTVRGTAWSVTLRLPAGASRWTVSASVPGSARVLPGTARRTLRLR